MSLLILGLNKKGEGQKNAIKILPTTEYSIELDFWFLKLNWQLPHWRGFFYLKFSPIAILDFFSQQSTVLNYETISITT